MASNVQSVSLADVILAAIEERLATFFTGLPGRVLSYDRAEQSATIQATVKNAYLDEEGVRRTEDLPVLQRVPVLFLGGGGFRTTSPVAAGDTCFVVFSSCSMDRLLAQGGTVDPGDDRRNTLNDAVAIVGLRDYRKPLKGSDGSGAPADTMSQGYDGGATIEYGPSKIQVGGATGTGKIVVQSALDVFCNALITASVGNPQLAALASALFTGGFNPISPPTSGDGLWAAGTAIAEAK